jgi:7,8-didemethyl-8-hydroxy-5-deazariboflavin synthase
MLMSTLNGGFNAIVADMLDGKTISKATACELINSSEVDMIAYIAKLIRDQSKQRCITYSRKVFINLINLCRDTCSYCTYKKEPNEQAASLMTPSQVLAIAEVGKKFKCTEALFITGEKPELKYGEARTWLKSLGYSSTIEYIAEMSETILRKTGLLPHTNAGNLTKNEILLLKDTNVSIGLMLESSSERLLMAGMPHEMAPSKNPKIRVKTLENSGQLKIPTTTGILVGIGETPEELIDSLFVIKEINRKYNHIQEVIIQNFSPKPETKMSGCCGPLPSYFQKVIALARIILGADMNIQVPPNLNRSIFGKFLDAGINDWGGISPVTIDHVNPEFPWPTIDAVKTVTTTRGYNLRARLPVYPEFLYSRDEEFIPGSLRSYIDMLSDDSGLVREDYLN